MMNKKSNKIHLEKHKIVQLGAYYTPDEYVSIAWNFIKQYINNNTVVLDTACGYGGFLREDVNVRKIGNDIDSKALEIAKKRTNAELFNFNALQCLDRKKFNISEDEKLIIVGNPPYNNVTSQAKRRIKQPEFKIDERVKSRDLGISFLRSFYYLKADYVCVLHPLSYLIKEANFKSLREFRENYKLLDGVIVSSKCFYLTSKTSEFPIIIALYEKNSNGMTYSYIQDFTFKTIEGKSFRLSDFDYIGRYISKYPNKKNKQNCELYFYTMRDINTLKRNKTFLEKPSSNSVCVDMKKIDYYVYVDVFKDFSKFIPYYLGNLDIIIDNDLFQQYKEYFISYSINKNPFLKKFYQIEIKKDFLPKVKEYFKLIKLIE